MVRKSKGVARATPGILCIGAQKAGTSWLHENLAKHPNIWVPPFKEIHFFDHKFSPDVRTWTEWHIKKSVRQTRERWSAEGALTEERVAYLDRIAAKPQFNGTWYKHIFSPCGVGQIGLDVTPEYCQISDEGIEFMKSFLAKDLRLLYMIRDPVDRAISQITMNLTRKKGDPASREEWLSAVDDPVVMRRGDYASYVTRWASAFPEKNLKFVPFGEVRQQPNDLLRDICQFCELDQIEFRGADKKVFANRRTIVPEGVRERLEEVLRGQRTFLERFFGRDFSRMC